MGALRDFIKRRLVRRELRKLEEKQPMIRKTLAWLTDPDHPGRKRGIAAGAAILSGVLRGAHTGLQKVCGEALLAAESFWCTADPTAWAGWIDVANVAVQTILIPGADILTVVFGVWGLIDAQRRAAQAKDNIIRPERFRMGGW